MSGVVDQLVEQLGDIRDRARSSAQLLQERERALRSLLSHVERLGGRNRAQREQAARDALRRLDAAQRSLEETAEKAADALATLQASGGGAVSHAAASAVAAVADVAADALEEIRDELGDVGEAIGEAVARIRGALDAPGYWALAGEELHRPMQAGDLVRCAGTSTSGKAFLLGFGPQVLGELAPAPADAAVEEAGDAALLMAEDASAASLRPEKDAPPAVVLWARQRSFHRMESATSRLGKRGWTAGHRKLMEYTDPRVAPAKAVSLAAGLTAGAAVSVLLSAPVGPAILAGVLVKRVVGHGGWLLVQDAKRRAGHPH